MTKYDFSTLNDKEFEEFTCELLNKQYSLELQSFKSGRDGGIDLRYSSAKNNNAIVVQVKQYYTKFKDLYTKLKNEELAKVEKLKPEQYWLVTSLPLSARNKDEIVQLFHGFIQNANFVLGREDLNRLLNKHKSIEKNWLKLWLSNTSVLQRMLNNGIYNRSEFYEEKIVRTVKRYVKNLSLDKAGKILKKNKFLLITGQPGVGKTTLANMVTYQFLAQGYQLVYINKDIAEAEYVRENWDRIITALWPHGSNSEKFEEFTNLFKYYDQNLSAFVKKPDHIKMFYNDLSTKADDETISLIYDYEDKLKSLEDVEELKAKVFNIRQEIFKGFYLEDKSYDESFYFRDLESEDRFAENKKRKKKAVKINTMKKKETTNLKEMEDYVNDLFSQFV